MPFGNQKRDQLQHPIERVMARYSGQCDPFLYSLPSRPRDKFHFRERRRPREHRHHGAKENLRQFIHPCPRHSGLFDRQHQTKQNMILIHPFIFTKIRCVCPASKGDWVDFIVHIH